ncbi:hypothetical protein IEQ34_018188 [Dendrobium chrysotoxum]|uniref:Splicing factor subunit n=1 Tax=Dendrobium chrysotoxum TaxID=161865 RepID=A0AAV7GDA1_DENCH|nr:hypothetical protein IEQ34_018188 [Dendrobium chrysotoxum]
MHLGGFKSDSYIGSTWISELMVHGMLCCITFDCASDRFNINSQLEHLQAKYVGTGHSDMNRFEWAVNIQRDSYASYVGHYPILAYFAIAENESIGRERYNFMQVSI